MQPRKQGSPSAQARLRDWKSLCQLSMHVPSPQTQRSGRPGGNGRWCWLGRDGLLMTGIECTPLVEGPKRNLDWRPSTEDAQNTPGNLPPFGTRPKFQSPVMIPLYTCTLPLKDAYSTLMALARFVKGAIDSSCPVQLTFYLTHVRPAQSANRRTWNRYLFILFVNSSSILASHQSFMRRGQRRQDANGHMKVYTQLKVSVVAFGTW
jgi:hypothetical protein